MKHKNVKKFKKPQKWKDDAKNEMQKNSKQKKVKKVWTKQRKTKKWKNKEIKDVGGG